MGGWRCSVCRRLQSGTRGLLGPAWRSCVLCGAPKNAWVDYGFEVVLLGVVLVVSTWAAGAVACATELGLAFGCAYAALVGHSCVKPVSVLTWRKIGWQRRREHLWQPRMVGMLERLLYVASLADGKAGFVAVWLVLKTAVRWTQWTQPEGPVSSRWIYQNFVLGNGLSLLYAAVGYALVGLVSGAACGTATWSAVAVMATGPALLPLAVAVWLSLYRD